MQPRKSTDPTRCSRCRAPISYDAWTGDPIEQFTVNEQELYRWHVCANAQVQVMDSNAPLEVKGPKGTRHRGKWDDGPRTWSSFPNARKA